MTDRIVIIPCGAKKRTGVHRAEDLYIGSYFKGCYNYAVTIAPKPNVYILSAKYGLLALGDEVESYNLTLGEPGCVSPRFVYKQAERRGLLGCDVVAIGGKKYTGLCRVVWPMCKTPLDGVGGFGKHLQWLKRHRGITP